MLVFTFKDRAVHRILQEKIKQVVQQHADLEALLQDPKQGLHPQEYQKLYQRHHRLESFVHIHQKYTTCQKQQEEAETLLNSSDHEIRELAKLEIESLKDAIKALEEELLSLMLPKEESPSACILEIRAGAGGLEAALFVGDVQRMYSLFAEEQGWKVRVMQASASEQGGYREWVAQIQGAGAYDCLKYESGTHRVQRIPSTENQGRIHTSTITVAVLPESEAPLHEVIQTSDLKVDTFRASGAGGQHVNTTNSAVRIEHLPTGLVVTCQDERSQHANRQKAMRWLQAKLIKKQLDAQRAKETDLRRQLIGSADRSERIRTYNIPQARLTDHRIHFTSHDLQGIFSGKLMPLLQALKDAERADMIQSLLDHDPS